MNEPAWSEPAETERSEAEFGWTEGEAAPILASPLATDDIPAAEEAEPEPEDTAAYPSDETSGDWVPQPAAERPTAAAAEAAARPSSETAPWDEPTAPVATAPAEWPEDPPREEDSHREAAPPAPEYAPEYVPEPPVADGY